MENKKRKFKPEPLTEERLKFMKAQMEADKSMRELKEILKDKPEAPFTSMAVKEKYLEMGWPEKVGLMEAARMIEEKYPGFLKKEREMYREAERQKELQERKDSSE